MCAKLVLLCHKRIDQVPGLQQVSGGSDLTGPAGLLDGEPLQQPAVLAVQPDSLPPEPKQDRPKQPKQRKSAQASAPVTHRVSLLTGPQ